MKLQEALSNIRPPDQAAMRRAKRHWDNLIKPLGSLGILEDHLIKIAGMTAKHQIDIGQKAVAVFCADNGVVAQGISQSGQEVTAIVAENMAVGDTCLCAMARVAGASVIPVDIGVAREPSKFEGLRRKKVRPGTADFTTGPAMSREEAVAAVETGISLALELYGSGFQMLATGEMGIGNTTTSAAMAAVLLGISPEESCGKGAGLSDQGLEHKIQVIKTGIQCNQPDPLNPMDVLHKVGGLDIAGMAGLCIGGAVCGIPVVLDGCISCVAALTACSLNPLVVHYLLPSHLSTEPAAGLVLRRLDLVPPIHAQMRLGEGTGAVAAFPLYDMALAVYNDMITFSQEDMEPYRPL